MLTIGDFARLGGVSVRMLRHYDATGLLEPARVDPASGYRYYAVDQLNRLDRLLALKDLGFTLDRVRTVLDDEVSPDELRGMLRLRRAELAGQLAADTARLVRVEARLRAIESESTMNTLTDKDFEVGPATGHRLAAATASVEDMSQVGPAVGPLFERVAAALGPAAAAATATVAQYTVSDDGGVDVLVGFPWDDAAPAGADLRVVDLPPVPTCAVTTYRGPVARIGEAWQGFVRALDAAGWQLDGPCREVYLATPFDDPDAWVTELRQPVRKA